MADKDYNKASGYIRGYQNVSEVIRFSLEFQCFQRMNPCTRWSCNDATFADFMSNFLPKVCQEPSDMVQKMERQPSDLMLSNQRMYGIMDAGMILL